VDADRVLRGEAGIGKSRLLETFIDAAMERGFACHLGRAVDISASHEGDAIALLVRDVLGLTAGSDSTGIATSLDAARRDRLVAPGDLVFLADLMGTSRPEDLRPTYEAIDNASREQGRRRAFARLVESASSRQPRIIALEDVHWASATTLACLASLAIATAASPTDTARQ
jgi:AAA ATPase domain